MPFQIMRYTASEIAQTIDGEVLGDASTLLKGFAPADLAKSGDLTFAENENYFVRAEQSGASAIIVEGRFTSRGKVLIRVANSRIAFAKVLPLFFPDQAFAPGQQDLAGWPGNSSARGSPMMREEGTSFVLEGLQQRNCTCGDSRGDRCSDAARR